MTNTSKLFVLAVPLRGTQKGGTLKEQWTKNLCQNLEGGSFFFAVLNPWASSIIKSFNNFEPTYLWFQNKPNPTPAHPLSFSHYAVYVYTLYINLRNKDLW